MSKDKTINGNIDPNYELREVEKGYVHIKCTERVHIPAEQRYKDVVRVIKLDPRQHKKNQDSGFYNKFNKSELLHDPSQEEIGEKVAEVKKTDKGVTADELRGKYALLFNEEAPKKMTKEDLEKAVSEKASEMEEDVDKDYKELLGDDAKEGLDIFDKIRAIEDHMSK